VLGSFEYSGQKCSASSRAYVPASLWPKLRDSLAAATEALTVGDVTGDLSIFTGAVIDDRAFAKQQAVFDRVKSVDSISVLAGGTADDSVGWFVRPTILVGTDPTDEVFTTEYFGPVLALHVYDDADLDSVVHGIDTLTPYGLTGAVIGRDRAQLAAMTERLRFAAGNFYINDKSTGAVVGQQPFGGARSSGTDDKAGAASNLMRWTATRAIKENLDPPRTISYPHVG
jgi:1-pyrroline-5-carboxylate dehydrogenase